MLAEDLRLKLLLHPARDHSGPGLNAAVTGLLWTDARPPNSLAETLTLSVVALEERLLGCN